jgi:CubicO group peptidase (beta-lactamase class C family)
MNTKYLHTHWITSAGHEGQSGPPGARFPYWSFTKTVIAIAALQLVERSKLKLDEPLENQPYTLRHLLAHTSGLPDYCAVDAYHIAVAKGEQPWPREHMLDRALRNGLLFEPGEGWSYSNIGYMFIGDLIESASSTSLATVIADNICKPLDLNSVELATTRADFSGLHWSEAENYDPRWVYHRCLTGTASDATRLLHALFSGKLLKPETLEQMLVRRSLGGPLAGRPWQSCGYSLGLMAGPMDGLGRVIGHSGCGPFSVNAVYHFPDVSDPITVSCFTDGTDEGVAEFEMVRKACEQREL